MTTGDTTADHRTTSTPAGPVTVPAGWYPDPEDATRLRRWDGRRWTDSWMRRGDGSALATRRSATPGTPAAATAGAPPGWHTDPWHATRSRFWDGTRWTGRVREGRPFPGRRPLTPRFFTLARAVQVGLVVCGVGAGVSGLASVWAVSVLDRWLRNPASASEAEGHRIDLVELFGAFGTEVLTLVTGVLFLVWLYRAYGSDRVDPGSLRLHRGWTIASWFVPIVLLWFPRRTVADLWRGARAGLGLDGTIPRRWRLEVWWVTWLVQLILSQVALRVSRSTGDGDWFELVRGLRAGARVEVAASLVTIVCAGFAVLVVRGVTATLDRPEWADPPPVATSPAQRSVGAAGDDEPGAETDHHEPTGAADPGHPAG